MKPNNIFHMKDFYAGLIFIFIGIVAVVEARDYSMGTIAHMGPGYFPYVLGGILILLGLIISVRPLLLSGVVIEPWALRPFLLVTIAVVAFTLLLQSFGLVLATLALVVISCLGGTDFKFREVIVLSMVLIALTVGLFVYFLKVPFKVWP